MKNDFEQVAEWELTDGVRATEFKDGRNLIVVRVEFCGLQSCMLQKHGSRKRSHGDQNWQTIISI